MTIPLVDLKAQYLSISNEIDDAISQVINSTRFILGKEVELFEEEFAAFCNAEYAIGTSSGTSALHLALLACGIGQADEVITTSHTFIATTEAISHVGARPVFVDIDLASYNIDPTKIEEVITPRTRAIIPIHLYGQPAEIGPILDIARKHGLKVIEDAAQAHGAEYKGQRLGALGDAGCFSFYPGKNLGAYGDAGMVVTNNEEIAKSVRLLRNHGRREKYEHLIEGYGYRLDAIQAAILRVKLKHLDEWTEKRRRNAALYDEFLKDTAVVTPKEMDYAKHVYHVYVIRAKERETLRTMLSEQGISSGIHYPIPLHLQMAYKHFGYREGDFPVTEQCASEVLSLPMFPELSERQIRTIAEAIRNFANKSTEFATN